MVLQKKKSVFSAVLHKQLSTTGVPVSVQYGADAINDLEVLLGEGIAPEQVIIGGLDRLDAVERKDAIAVATSRCLWWHLDHVGWATLKATRTMNNVFN